jgi:hypothetical protein
MAKVIKAIIVIELGSDHDCGRENFHDCFGIHRLWVILLDSEQVNERYGETFDVNWEIFDEV